MLLKLYEDNIKWGHIVRVNWSSDFVSRPTNYSSNSPASIGNENAFKWYTNRHQRTDNGLS